MALRCLLVQSTHHSLQNKNAWVGLNPWLLGDGGEGKDLADFTSEEPLTTESFFFFLMCTSFALTICMKPSTEPIRTLALKVASLFFKAILLGAEIEPNLVSEMSFGAFSSRISHGGVKSQHYSPGTSQMLLFLAFRLCFPFQPSGTGGRLIISLTAVSLEMGEGTQGHC